MSWNLPDGCTDRDIDMAAGGYEEPEPEDDFDWEAYAFDCAFELVAEAHAAWSEAVFAEATAIARRPVARETGKEAEEGYGD